MKSTLQPFLVSSVLISILFLAGCGGSRGLDTTKPIAPEDVISLTRERNAQVRAVTGFGTISIDTPELSNAGNIEVRLLKPDSLLFEITGPFGVRAAKGLITGSNFTFYNGLENTVAEGATTAKNMKNILRLSMEFRDALDIISGTMRIAPRDSNMRMTGKLEDNYYRITYSDANWIEEYLVSLAYQSVKQYTRRDSRGEIVEDITFKDFRKKSGLFMPGIISIERLPTQESLVLSYEQFTLNDLPVDFEFKVPKSARKIRY
jgi:hypothetical protein